MDFKIVVLFLLVYFIRPQDWVSALLGVGVVTPIMIAAIGAMLHRAKTEGRRLEFFRTPHDWAMLAYYVYIVWTSSDPSGTLKEAFPLFAFYFVTVQALSSPQRLHTYLKAWLWAVFTLAAFGMLSLYGWDITGAVATTEGMLGRLALGTWMHNNPNALGHTVMTAIPLAYFLYFWKKGVPSKLVAILIWIVCFSAVVETESKGAVLAGFITLVLAYSFGRSKIVQILLVAAALAGGGAAISLMPRMEQMSSLRSDEGVQGRLLAWEQARLAVNNDFTGAGWKTFHAVIKWNKTFHSKATHSSYVKIGADLGYPGMFIYVGILWLAFKTLIRARPADEHAQRSRQCLFTLITAYVVSNWMIDRAYHTEFFLSIAAIGAFHRLVFLKAPAEEEVPEVGPVTPAWQITHHPAWLPLPEPRSFSGGGALKASLWRPSAIDCVIASLATWLVFYIWDYVLKNL